MLPDGWKRVRLGDIARISSGGTPDRSEPRYWNGDIPWVTTGEIQFNTITDTAEKITAEGLKHSSAKLFPPGTLLMAMYGQGKTRGQVAKLGIEAATNQACAAMRLSDDCDLDYIYQCLASHYEAIRELGNAGAQQNLSAALVKGITLPLPPQQEQVRIGALASCWDEAIASTGQLLANSRRQKQDLMQGLLTGHRTFGVDSGQWSHVEFDQVFERVTRKNTAGDQNVLTISGQHGLISQREYFSRVVASDDLSGYTHLSTGDFAYNKSSSNGYPMGAIKPLVAYDSGVVSSLYICFRIRPGVEADEDFFSHYFDAGMLNDEITGIAQEGARSHGLLNVSVKEFFKLRMRVPPLEDQRRIAQVLNTAQEEIRNIEEQLERLKTEKRALMNELLTGKRRVRTPAKSEEAREPA
jgi:type I restriction enzyme, S subunit